MSELSFLRMARLGDILIDLLGLAGAASAAYGAWQVYPPSGWIVGGLLALTAAWRLARG